jgi:hypothetical protein
MRIPTPLHVCLAVVAAILCGACGDDTPTAPTDTPRDPVTQTFASNITPSGHATRFISTAQAGTIVVKLDSLSPSVPMGLGIGIARADTHECFLSTVFTVSAGDEALRVDADSGAYCVQLFDVGNLEGPAAFSITLTYP